MLHCHYSQPDSGMPALCVDEHIATHRQNRRKGYASAMLDFASDFAKEKGCYKVMFMTGHLSDKIKKFCQASGFESGVKNAYIKRWEF